MELLPENLRAAAADKLIAKIAARQWTIGTGFLGTPALLETLTRTGHADVAYRLLLNTQYPSWGYMIEHGATTMWERWNGNQKLDDPQMNSFNHYAYGAVGGWLYRFGAGIDFDPEDPGFHHIVLHPTFDGKLGSVEATYQSPYGPIQSAWTVSGNLTTWKTVIPPNSSALIVLPVKENTTVLLDGKDAVLHAHAAMARAGTALGHLAVFGTGAVAVVAIDLGGDLDLLLDAEHGFLEVQIHHVAQVGTAARTLAATATPEDVTEDVAKDVADVAEAASAAATTEATALEGGMAVLVVRGALLRIRQYVVGFLGFLEFVDRRRVVRIAVGVVLHRDATKGRLEVALSDGAFDTENFVVVALAHRIVSQPLRGLSVGGMATGEA